MTRRDLRAKLLRLASHRPALERGFDFGAWEGGDRLPDGSIQMPWYRLSDDAEALLRDFADAGWIEPFDWPAWVQTAKGRQLMTEPAAVEDASAQELGRLLTSLVRGERFGDGTLEQAYETGILTAIACRAEALVAELADDDGGLRQQS